MTIDTIVLVWLAVRQNFERSKLLNSLKDGFAGGRKVVDRHLRGATERLLAAGLVERRGQTIVLTPVGRREALDALGLAELPAHKKVDWRWAKKMLRVRALGLAITPVTTKRAGEADWTSAAILAREHGLSLQDGSHVLQDLALRALGLEAGDDIHGPRAFCALVLGADLTQKGDDVDAATPTANGASLDAFAQSVNRIARESTSGRWHDGQVFISHVWEAFRKRSDRPEMTWPQFQARLLAAHTAGLVHLIRADLAPTMPSADVQASETSDLHTSFHFVRIE